MKVYAFRFCLSVGVFSWLTLFWFTENVRAEDLNCMLCHKYFGLNVIDKKGKIRIFYINEALIERSPHARVECIDCHEGIDEVPHKDVKQVDCTTECHVDEPSTKRRFSHKAVEVSLRQSAHSKLDKNGKRKKYPQDYPSCRQCHEQPLYRTLVGISDDFTSVEKKSLSRCKSCHEKGYFAEQYFQHIATRLQRQSHPLNRIKICASCHANKEIIKRHEMDDVVSSFKETFHYKMLSLGSEKTPDCIDCHVVSGVNGHLIKTKKDPKSPTHTQNVGQMCRQSGCHSKASAKLAGFQTHVTYEKDKYFLQFVLLTFFRIVMSVVLFGFLVVVFLELLRRLFPHYELPDLVVTRITAVLRRVYVPKTERDANK